eukprot:GDKJ01002314.1.p1 GENE.GDKJ01002314.1~~GDKJ01002314.1.p1  ORF type:complete len:386 (-),score=74.33 GDKJ01002314.1:91-1212(-)
MTQMYYQSGQNPMPVMRPSMQNQYHVNATPTAIPLQRPSYGAAVVGYRRPSTDAKGQSVSLNPPQGVIPYTMMPQQISNTISHNAVLPQHSFVSAPTSVPAARPPSNVVVASPAQHEAANSLGQLMSTAISFCDARENDNRVVSQKASRFKAETDRLSKSLDVFSAVIGATQSKVNGPGSLTRVAPPPTANEPPFVWEPSADYISEFNVSGRFGEVVTKEGDFEDQGWVIPVAGSLRMLKGASYRWGIQIIRKCPHRPQLQFGVHGVNHDRPWRLITTSRCSRSRDDEPWQDRPGGDRLIDEGDTVWLEVDLRGVTSTHGTLSYAINDEPWEVAFTDIPLFDIENQADASAAAALMPVVCMGGHGCAVKVLPF